MPNPGAVPYTNDSDTPEGEAMPLITRVLIENYKSIAECDVRLGPLTFLVGRNGSGKSNFLDAFRFVADALRMGLDTAVRSRGSVDDLQYRGGKPGAIIGLQFDMTLPDNRMGHYLLRLTKRQYGGHVVAEEQCTVEFPATGHAPTGFHIRNGQLLKDINSLQVPTDRLYLASSLLGYEDAVLNVLANMAFYRPIPAHMRGPQPHEAGDLLLPDGSNVASVLLRLAREQPDVLDRINEYMRAVLPSLREVRALPIGGYDALQFHQEDESQNPIYYSPRVFSAVAMSDGTLHALGVLVALFQGGFGERRKPSVVGIEEPETALHPAATAVLRDAFADTAELAQVIITTQSADLLDAKDVDPEWIRVVQVESGSTRIGPLREKTRSIVRDHLATAGELLRSSPLEPETDSAPSARKALPDE